MKVLSFNIGYLLGFQSQREWLRRPHRLFFGDKTTENNGIDTIVNLLKEERPDVVAFQEVDLGSFRSRFTDQCDRLIKRLNEEGLNYDYRADTKYGEENKFAKLPVLRHMSNAVLWKEGQAFARYLSKGTKRLVHVVEQDQGPHVMSVHLSKTRDTRKEQLRELKNIGKDYDSVIITGDFNVKHQTDYSIISEKTDLQLHIPGKSFSTDYPSYEFDIFFSSDWMDIERCEVINEVTVSDHMPVIAEFNTTQ